MKPFRSTAQLDPPRLAGQYWDNAAAESFWAKLKVEFCDRYLWPTKTVAKLAVGYWIERIYNRRHNSYLGNISPTGYETLWTPTYSIPQIA
jgi:putative transposase